MLDLTELDEATRRHMVAQFEAAFSSPDRYVPRRLTTRGVEQWPELFSHAIREGNDDTLRASLLADPALIVTTERHGPLGRERRVNFLQAAELLATSEFNTFYVHGLSAKLLEEGVDEVQVYRAAASRRDNGECARYEGAIVQVRAVYDGHRAKYWPTDNPSAFSVPFHSGCHHSIQRIAPNN